MLNWDAVKSAASRHRIKLAASAAIMLALFIILISPVFQECVKANNYSDGKQSLNESSWVFIWSLWYCGGLFAKENGEAITGIATIIMAIFTGTLWWTSAEQGKIAQRSINLARDEFNATHRPRIVVQQIDKAYPGSFGKSIPASIELSVANAGESLATILSWDARLYFRSANSAFTPFLNPLTVETTPIAFDIASGDIKPVAAQHREVEGEYADFIAGEAEMFIVGSILYRGPDLIERRTGFCRKYQGEPDGRWHPMDDAAYDYAY